VIDAPLGDTKAALAWVEKAIDDRARRGAWLAVDPMLDGLSEIPAFQLQLTRTRRQLTS
jgi:hypothetical protein